MSPTFFRHRSYRFYVNSREEKRMHIHVHTPDGEAKYWLEPLVELAVNFGIKNYDLKEIEIIIMEKQNEFKDLWKKHFNQ
ncbi:DUF4160 domain-containing protein [bacterium]|nr:DUF4160 domain-containing protein [bacterium]